MSSSTTSKNVRGDVVGAEQIHLCVDLRARVGVPDRNTAPLFL
jgi:hypothetical protein